MAASAIDCSFWPRHVGKRSLTPSRASDRQVTLPRPKMPNRPGKRGASWPSITVRWAMSQRTSAWAMVRRIVDMPLPPLVELGGWYSGATQAAEGSGGDLDSQAEAGRNGGHALVQRHKSGDSVILGNRDVQGVATTEPAVELPKQLRGEREVEAARHDQVPALL